MVTAYNLHTGEERVYSDLHPENAVMTAYLQEHGNYNTWTYNDRFAEMRSKIVRGKYSIAYGDWATPMCLVKGESK